MSEFYNQLTPAQLERLAKLLEEMGEAQQIIGKILCHGYESYDPTDPEMKRNRAYLEMELGDVVLFIDSLLNAGDISRKNLQTRMVDKKSIMNKYLHHQS